MRLFINSARKWNENVSISQKDGIVTLRIPEYSEKLGIQKWVDFVIPNIKKGMLKNNTWICNLQLEEISENKIVFGETWDPYVGAVYALLKSTKAVPDDVYIPKSKKSKVEVIRRIRFWDCEGDLGNFLSNVYFIKITLNHKEKFPVILTHQNAQYMKKEIVFSRNAEGLWAANVVSKKINNENGKYISLAELCEI